MLEKQHKFLLIGQAAFPLGPPCTQADTQQQAQLLRRRETSRCGRRLRVAKICNEIAENSEGGLGNFRFCASLNFDEHSFCPFSQVRLPRRSKVWRRRKAKDILCHGLENGVDFRSACQKAKTMSNLADSIVAVFTPSCEYTKCVFAPKKQKYQRVLAEIFNLFLRGLIHH